MGITDRFKAGLAAFGLAAGLHTANAQTIDPKQYDLNKIGADKLQMFETNSPLGKPQSVTDMAECLEQATTQAKAQNTGHGLPNPNSRLAIWALCSKDGKPVAMVYFNKNYKADNSTITPQIVPKNMAVFDAANKGVTQKPNGIPEELIPQGRRRDRLRRAMEAQGAKPSGPSGPSNE